MVGLILFATGIILSLLWLKAGGFDFIDLFDDEDKKHTL